MFHNLYVTFTIVFPFMAFLALGAFLKRIKVLDDAFSSRLNRFLTQVLLPVNIFNSLYSRDISAVFRQPSALYIFLGMAIDIPVIMWIVKHVEKDPAKQGAMVHCGFRTNAMLFALPLAHGIFGRDVPEITISLAVVVLINNLVAVPILEYYRNLKRKEEGRETEKSRFSLKALLKDIFSTPLLDGVILGIIWSFIGIPVPDFCAKVISDLSAPVVPLAFVILGSRLRMSHLKANRKNVAFTVLLKTVYLPAVFLIWPLVKGWPEISLIAVLISFGAPSAVIAYPLTEAYECDGEMAGEIVSLT